MQQNDAWLDMLRDRVRDGDAVDECESCGILGLVFAYHLRAPVPGDEDDVYTVGEAWQCVACGALDERYDSDR